MLKKLIAFQSHDRWNLSGAEHLKTTHIFTIFDRDITIHNPEGIAVRDETLLLLSHLVSFNIPLYPGLNPTVLIGSDYQAQFSFTDGSQFQINIADESQEKIKREFASGITQPIIEMIEDINVIFEKAPPAIITVEKLDYLMRLVYAIRTFPLYQTLQPQIIITENGTAIFTLEDTRTIRLSLYRSESELRDELHRKLMDYFPLDFPD